MIRFIPLCSSEAKVEEKESCERDNISFYIITLSTTVRLEKCLLFIENLQRIVERMRFLHKAINVVLRPLEYCELKTFIVKTAEKVEWECVLLVASHFCIIRESKNMWTVWHYIVGNEPCIRSMVTMKNIISGLIATEEWLKNTAMIVIKCTKSP